MPFKTSEEDLPLDAAVYEMTRQNEVEYHAEEEEDVDILQPRERDRVKMRSSLSKVEKFTHK